MALKFEWDSLKATKNLAKHGVSFEEAATVFGDPRGRINGDPRHSVEEERFVVMYAERAEAIRVISARQATHHERGDYEKTP